MVQLRLSVLAQLPSIPAGRRGEFQHALQLLTTEDGYNSGRCEGEGECEGMIVCLSGPPGPLNCILDLNP